MSMRSFLQLASTVLAQSRAVHEVGRPAAVFLGHGIYGPGVMALYFVDVVEQLAAFDDHFVQRPRHSCAPSSDNQGARQCRFP